MRSIEDKGCVNSNGTTPELSSASCMSFEFHKSNGGVNNRTSQHRTSLGKPTPSKWDDAQKWLVNLSRGEKNPTKSSPRNSNADDRRLIAPVPKKDYSSGDEEGEENVFPGGSNNVQTKNVDCGDDSSIWRINKYQHQHQQVNNIHNTTTSKSVVRSICVRDMGTEMTPIASQEPSRAATPIRATTPAARSPVSSPSSTPVRCDPMPIENGPNVIATPTIVPKGEATRQFGNAEEVNVQKFNSVENQSSTGDQSKKVNPMELRAMAWDEAERAKYTARYKREEIKIQAWENHEKRKAEMEMRKVEVKAERLKSRAQEKYTNKLASTRRIAEEKRANADAKLNEKAVKTSEKADYIRRTGHLPSALSFKFRLPSFCW